MANSVEKSDDYSNIGPTIVDRTARVAEVGSVPKLHHCIQTPVCTMKGYLRHARRIILVVLLRSPARTGEHIVIIKTKYTAVYT